MPKPSAPLPFDLLVIAEVRLLRDVRRVADPGGAAGEIDAHYDAAARAAGRERGCAHRGQLRDPYVGVVPERAVAIAGPVLRLVGGVMVDHGPDRSVGVDLDGEPPIGGDAAAVEAVYQRLARVEDLLRRRLPFRIPAGLPSGIDLVDIVRVVGGRLGPQALVARDAPLDLPALGGQRLA